MDISWTSAVSKSEAIRYMIRRGVFRTYAEASNAGMLARLSVPGLAYNMTTMARVEKLITDVPVGRAGAGKEQS